MPKVKLELTAELVEAIDAERGGMSRGEFIETGMRASMKPKLKLDRTQLLKERAYR